MISNSRVFVEKFFELNDSSRMFECLIVCFCCRLHGHEAMHKVTHLWLNQWSVYINFICSLDIWNILFIELEPISHISIFIRVVVYILTVVFLQWIEFWLFNQSAISTFQNVFRIHNWASQGVHNNLCWVVTDWKRFFAQKTIFYWRRNYLYTLTHLSPRTTHSLGLVMVVLTRRKSGTIAKIVAS